MVMPMRRGAPAMTHESKSPYFIGRITTLCVVTLLASLTGCASSRELTRARAAEMIGNSEDFRAPITLPLKKETDLNVRAEPEGDTEAVATDRATKTYYQFNPQMDVLRQSGIIEVRAVVRKRPDENYGVWSFDVEPILTEKGKKFASGEQGARCLVPQCDGADSARSVPAPFASTC